MTTKNNSWYRIGEDMFARDLWVSAPLDWNDPQSKKIDIFAREIVSAEQLNPAASQAPVLIYLEGGPGGKGQRPTQSGPFLKAALKRFRVVMPDQRGTGRSSPSQETDFENMTAAEGAKQLSFMRADSIIKDFELIRKEHFNGEPWWSLGHSYGGFMTLTYLSYAPEGLVASAITGGLPNIVPDPEQVYRRTFPRTRAKNEQFYVRFPHLVERVNKIADIIQNSDVRLPNGDQLTVRRLQTLGFGFGMGRGFEEVHWIFDEAFADKAESVLSRTFLEQVQQATQWSCEPLYIALQEAIYGAGPSEWAAQRVRAEQADFDESARPVLFTGEMAFPWMFDEVSGLRGFQAAVNELASNEWPIEVYSLSDLKNNKVPVEAAVYFDDMYVDAGLSLETAARVGSLHAWVTNEFEHDGLEEGEVAERLFAELERRVALNNA